MNYHGVLEYLTKIQEKGAKLSLENIQKIIDHFPFDLNSISFIQIAGTNGKGSTSHFITSMLKSAGHKVGLFTSPHLQDIRERISINKEWISRDHFSQSLSRVKRIVESLYEKKVIDDIPTFFEHLLLTALDFFVHEKVDYAVLEVGLGGRLDATSTITPVISVITNISLDHTKTLGKRIQDIATEKAGIIKPGVPIVCGCSVRSIANRTIRKIADQRQSEFFNVFDRDNTLSVADGEKYQICQYTTKSDQYTFELQLQGKHQGKNAATAIKVFEVLNRHEEIFPMDAILSGIKQNFVPGRIEHIPASPKIILDSGHNLEGIKALSDFLAQKDKKNLTLVFGVLRDKKYKKMVDMLLPFTKNVILTEPVSKRALPAEKLSHLFSGKKVFIEKSPLKALESARILKNEILITGSFYLAGVMRNIIYGE
jgi:dihydrofolate synthase/folylpolyglutamate synthase